jgi:uridine kinase
LKSIFRSKLFLLGLAIKIICLFFFVSSVPRDLFIPFFDRAVTHLGENPWSLSAPQSFPYGGFLFLVLFLPKLLLYSIFGDLALGDHALSIFALKAPLLGFDFLFLFILVRLAQERRLALVSLYWLNPILFYITYIHGQLDVASMALLALSLFFLVRNETSRSGLVMGLATASKFHVVAAAPFLLVYIWNREFRGRALSKIGKWTCLWLGVALLCFVPVILANRVGQATVASPEIQRFFAAKLVLSGTTTLYLGVVISLLVLGRLVVSTRISELGLFFGTGAIFTSLVISSHPATGWFYWCIPFFSMFFALYLNVPRSLFWLMSILYAFVYVVPEWVSVERLESGLYWSVLYTALQASLIANLIAMWIVVLRKESLVSRRASPLRIGIAGDSGSGKDQFTETLQDIFGPKNVTVIEGDNYHKWERGADEWQRYTHLNPNANHLFSLAEHVATISRGRPVLHAIYSHETGRFTSPIEVRPTKTLVVQGLHTFYLRNMRNLFDLKIFLSPEHEVRKAWKMKRDVIERGYDKFKILAQLAHRGSDSKKYIDSQQGLADLIVRYELTTSVSDLDVESGCLPPLRVKWVVWNDIDLSALKSELNKYGVNAVLAIEDDNLNRASLTADGAIDVDKIAAIADTLFGPLRHVTRGKIPPRFRSDYEGISQLIALLLLNYKFQNHQFEAT